MSTFTVYKQLSTGEVYDMRTGERMSYAEYQKRSMHHPSHSLSPVRYEPTVRAKDVRVIPNASDSTYATVVAGRNRYEIRYRNFEWKLHDDLHPEIVELLPKF